MHHYRKNIGDYHRKAGRLSILQHGVYNLLMDAIYDRERFPTRSEAIDWVWASTPEEEQAVDFVLRKFFVLQDDETWVQSRMLDELNEYWDFCKKQGENGKKGGRPKKPSGNEKKPSGFSEKPSGNPVATQRVRKKSLTTNHQPLTTKRDPPVPPQRGEQKPRKRFKPPTVDEVRAYCAERQNMIDPEAFIDHYQTNGWVQGKGKPVKDWKACIRTWERNRNEQNRRHTGQPQQPGRLSAVGEVRAARERAQGAPPGPFVAPVGSHD